MTESPLFPQEQVFIRNIEIEMATTDRRSSFPGTHLWHLLLRRTGPTVECDRLWCDGQEIRSNLIEFSLSGRSAAQILRICVILTQGDPWSHLGQGRRFGRYEACSGRSMSWQYAGTVEEGVRIVRGEGRYQFLEVISRDIPILSMETAIRRALEPETRSPEHHAIFSPPSLEDCQNLLDELNEILKFTVSSDEQLQIIRGHAKVLNQSSDRRFKRIGSTTLYFLRHTNCSVFTPLEWKRILDSCDRLHPDLGTLHPEIKLVEDQTIHLLGSIVVMSSRVEEELRSRHSEAMDCFWRAVDQKLIVLQTSSDLEPIEGGYHAIAVIRGPVLWDLIKDNVRSILIYGSRLMPESAIKVIEIDLGDRECKEVS